MLVLVRSVSLYARKPPEGSRRIRPAPTCRRSWAPLAQRSVTPLVERSVESSTKCRHLSSGGWFQALSSTPSILPNAWCGSAPARAPTPVREHTHTTTHTRSKVQTSEDLACYAKPCVAAFASECPRCCGVRKSKRPPSRRSLASERASPARTNEFRTQKLTAAM